MSTDPKKARRTGKRRTISRTLIRACAACHRVRMHSGRWEPVAPELLEHPDASVSHGICPQCGEKLYGEYYQDER